MKIIILIRLWELFIIEQIEYYQEQYGVKQIENCSLSEDVLRVVGDMSLENMISSEQVK